MINKQIEFFVIDVLSSYDERKQKCQR